MSVIEDKIGCFSCLFFPQGKKKTEEIDDGLQSASLISLLSGRDRYFPTILFCKIVSQLDRPSFFHCWRVCRSWHDALSHDPVFLLSQKRDALQGIQQGFQQLTVCQRFQLNVEFWIAKYLIPKVFQDVVGYNQLQEKLHSAFWTSDNAHSLPLSFSHLVQVKDFFPITECLDVYLQKQLRLFNGASVKSRAAISINIKRVLKQLVQNFVQDKQSCYFMLRIIEWLVPKLSTGFGLDYWLDELRRDAITALDLPLQIRSIQEAIDSVSTEEKILFLEAFHLKYISTDCVGESPEFPSDFIQLLKEEIEDSRNENFSDRIVIILNDVIEYLLFAYCTLDELEKGYALLDKLVLTETSLKFLLTMSAQYIFNFSTSHNEVLLLMGTRSFDRALEICTDLKLMPFHQIKIFQQPFSTNDLEEYMRHYLKMLKKAPGLGGVIQTIKGKWSRWKEQTQKKTMDALCQKIWLINRPNGGDHG